MTESPDKPSDKRISPRRAIRTRVVLEDEAGRGFLYLVATDLSHSGIFVESPLPFPSGTRLFLCFTLHEGDSPIQVTGQVTRIEGARRGPGRKPKFFRKGIGIRFVGLNVEDYKKIDSFIKGG